MRPTSTTGFLAIVAIAVGLWLWQRSDGAEGETQPAQDQQAPGGRDGTAGGPPTDRDGMLTGEAAMRLARAEGDAPDAELARKRRGISGKVLGPGDAPLPAATVTLHEILTPWPRQELRRIQSVYTDSLGMFEFHPWDDVDLLVEVSADGHALTREPVPQAVSDLTVRLSYGFDVVGFVQQSFAGNKKAADCEVVIAPGSWGLQRGRSTRTDSNGEFRFRNVPAGLVRLSARSDLFNPATAPMVPVGGTEDRVRLVLQWVSRPVNGTVVEVGTNQPVVGAEVAAYPASWNGELHVPVVAKSDERGNFQLKGLGQSNLRIRVRHPDFSATSRMITPRPGPSRGLRFELVNRSRVRGRLLGDGVEGQILRMETFAGEKGRAYVDSDGRFEFDGAWSASRAKFEIVGGAFAFQRSSSRFIEGSIAEDETTEFSFVVTVPSSIRGRVVDDSGKPVVAARVSTINSIREHRASLVSVTDDDGNWELLGLPVSETQLSVTHESFAMTEVYVTVPGAGKVAECDTVVLVPAGQLEGRVTRDGRPLSGAVVFAGQPKRNRATVTDPDGRFLIRGLQPGDYRVKARYSTLPFGIVDGTVAVRSGETASVPDIKVQAGRRIAGNVTDLNGRPIANALVYVPGSFGASIRTDENGKFGLEIDAEATSFQVYDPTFSVWVRQEIPKEWSDDGDLQMAVDLPVVPRGTFRARVLGLPDRKPLTSGVIRVRSLDRQAADTPGRNITSRVVEMTGGRLDIDWIPIGESEITLHCQGYLPFVQNVTVRRRPQPPETVLLEPGVPAHIRIVDEAGNPVPNAKVFMGRETDIFDPRFQAQGTTDAGGYFAVRGVGAESDTVVVYSKGYTVAEIAFAIPEDLLRLKEDPRVLTLKKASKIRAQIRNSEDELVDGVIVIRKGEVFVGQAFVIDGEAVEFTTFGAGQYRVMVFGDEGSEQVVTIRAESGLYDLTLRSEGG